MKQILLSITFLFSFVFTTYSQEIGALQFVENVLEVQSMRELNKFRDELIKELKSLDMSNITPEESNQLATIYEKMRVEYNGLIGLIKQDVLDFKNIKMLNKNSSELSKRYKTTIDNVSSIFNDEFLPAYSSLSQDRNLIALIFPLIEKGIRFIIDVIKNNKLKKETLLNDILLVANSKFNSTLVLPEWNSIVRVSSISTLKQSSPTEVIINQTNTKSGKLSNLQPVDTFVQTGNKSLNVEYPVMKEVFGTIEFTLNDGSILNFDPPQTLNKNRDLTVGSKTTFSKNAFVSQNILNEGDAFQIRTTNTAFIYVFAFNSDNKCYSIYPYSSDWVRGFNMSKDRDLGVGPLMMKDENNLLVIPSKNIETNEDNFIQVSGKNTKEQLCLILSKSEINLEELFTSIESLNGVLSDRLDKVLYGKNIGKLDDLNIENKSGRIYFNVDSLDKWIFPLIFEIKR